MKSDHCVSVGVCYVGERKREKEREMREELQVVTQKMLFKSCFLFN
jgi:hypothetical protein